MKPTLLSTIIRTGGRFPWDIFSRKLSSLSRVHVNVNIYRTKPKSFSKQCCSSNAMSDSNTYCTTSASAISGKANFNSSASSIVQSQSNDDSSAMSSGTGDHLERTAGQSRQPEVVQMKVTKISDISPTVKQLILSTDVRPVPISFKAGQWLDMFIPGVETVGGFSICSSPMHLQKTGELYLSVKKSEHPPSDWVHTQCKEGSELSVRIGGEFFLDTSDPKNAGKSILLLAGGVGINPLMSIIAQIQDYKKYVGVYSSRTLLMFTAKSHSELLFQNYFAKVSEEDPTFSVKYFLTGNCDDRNVFFTDDLKKGRITKSDIVRSLASCLHVCVGFEDFSNTIAYICGPPPMIKDTEDILKSIGLTNISYEKWW